MAEPLELADIQGTVLRNRPMPYFGAYLVFRLDDGEAARRGFARLLPHVTSAKDWAAPADKACRIGGMVKAGSIQRKELTVHFVITDTAKEVPVSYTGILPDLFSEGKGAVVQGKLGADGHFTASEVLAKHDENYMPPEAKHAIDQAQKADTTAGAKP